MSKKPADDLMGLKSFTIAGHLTDRRLRCLGMTDEERRWRAQWLKDQVLSPEEPRFSPEYYRDTTNCFRRLYKTPLNKLQSSLQASLGENLGSMFRHLIGKGAAAIAIIYLGHYFLKYHTNDFTIFRTVETYRPRSIMFPDHPDYPNFPVKENFEYYDLGFHASVLCQDVEPPPPPPPPPSTAFVPDESCNLEAAEE